MHVPEKYYKDIEFFNEPWMENLDQGLLYRYWKKKGCPGYLLTYTAGVKMVYKDYGEGMGIVGTIPVPMFDDHRYPETKGKFKNEKPTFEDEKGKTHPVNITKKVVKLPRFEDLEPVNEELFDKVYQMLSERIKNKSNAAFLSGLYGVDNFIPKGVCPDCWMNKENCICDETND